MLRLQASLPDFRLFATPYGSDDKLSWPPHAQKDIASEDDQAAKRNGLVLRQLV
jgi:hypothetical protein